jgi:imidazolonepropionase-like amidohydrolase
MTPHRASRIAAFTGLALALAAGRVLAQDGPWVLTNARIFTVTHGVIERGTIVIRDGLIAAVGADVAAPADARVLDLAGRTVFPAFIDLTSSLGLPSAPASAGAGRGAAPVAAAAAPAGPSNVGLEPDRIVADEVRPSASDVQAARDAGFGAVLVAPSRGAFRGLSALLPLRDSVASHDILRSPVALHMGYQSAPGRYPGTLMGVIAYERQAFYDARRQALLLERYHTAPRGMKRPAYDAGLAALIPVVRGDLPVLFAAGNENEIRRAVAMGREFNLALHVVGASEAFRAIDALQANRRTVVVSVDFPRAPEVTGWAFRSAQRLPPNDSAAADSAARQVIEGNAAALVRAGVRVALASGGSLRGSEVVANVRKAIAAGLPRDAALEALTIRPAEVAGAAEQLGSVDVGKIANLVVADGEPLTDSARVRAVFVDGIRYEVVPPATAGRGAGRGGSGGPGGSGAAATAQIGGTWSVTTNTPQGSQTATLTITQTGESFAGTMNSEMGALPVADGQITGRTVSWSITIQMGGQSMTVNFRGDVEGTRMRGTAELGAFGTAPFTAEKNP